MRWHEWLRLMNKRQTLSMVRFNQNINHTNHKPNAVYKLITLLWALDELQQRVWPQAFIELHATHIKVFCWIVLSHRARSIQHSKRHSLMSCAHETNLFVCRRIVIVSIVLSLCVWGRWQCRWRYVITQQVNAIRQRLSTTSLPAFLSSICGHA